MTRHINATITRSLLFSVFFIACSAVALPAFGDDKKVSNGCTMSQLQSPQGTRCIKKMDEDLAAKPPRPIHNLFCLGSELKCCIKSKTGDGFSNCEDLPPFAPKPDITCADMDRAKGVWTSDPKSIKANADKKTCSQVYTCNPPSELPLNARAMNCKPVVSVSQKQVTQNGTCVPGSSPGTCSSCLGNPPNDPCTVTFTK
jgi:hypothetical protein